MINETRLLFPDTDAVHGQCDQGLVRALEEGDRGRRLWGRILNYFQEEQTDSAAPRKNNRLHTDTENGSTGIEIRCGQKSKSHQRQSSKGVKMKQFGFINIRVLGYVHDTSLKHQSSLAYWCRTGTLKDCSVKKSHGIIESLRFEKTSKIIKSNRHLNTTMPAKPCPKVPHLHVF